jgi:hypothetical protein
MLEMGILVFLILGATLFLVCAPYKELGTIYVEDKPTGIFDSAQVSRVYREAQRKQTINRTNEQTKEGK